MESGSLPITLPNIGVDLGGQPGRAPPIIVLGAKVSFCPPIIQVRIFLNRPIETSSETKTRILTTTRYVYHNENNYFNYLHPIIFKIFKPSLSAKLTCRTYCIVYIRLANVFRFSISSAVLSILPEVEEMQNFLHLIARHCCKT